jgi:predicted phage baseplate assembly protein
MMSLPIPNLDDRRFQDIVDQAKYLLSSKCPEWTNLELTDPGVALVEVFAWVAEMVIYRLNQVPDVFYTRMLDLLGVQRYPPQAARADMSFRSSGPISEVTVVPAGTEVATASADPVVFSTIRDVVLRPARLIVGMSMVVSGGTYEPRESHRYDEDEPAVGLNLGGSRVLFENLMPGEGFYFGFSESMGGTVVRLDMDAWIEGVGLDASIEELGVDPHDPPVVWEIWGHEGLWSRAAVDVDTTAGFTREGFVELRIPSVHASLELGGISAFWLRVRLVYAREGQPPYRASPHLSRVRASCVGGTVTAEHAHARVVEVLGVSDGLPDQRYSTAAAPVLARREGEVVRTVSPDSVLDWEEVSSFADSGPDDLHVIWDGASGEIRFGPQIRYPDGRVRLHGAVPPPGAEVTVTGYRCGGGAEGNVQARTLTVLKSPVAGITSVTNPERATGGVDVETVENLKRRGPMALSAGQRAVTAHDFERLALEATPSIARVRCVPIYEAMADSHVTALLVVPHTSSPPGSLVLDDLALTDATIQVLIDALEPRRMVGSTIEIGTPYYQGVSVAALLLAFPGRSRMLLRQQASEAICRFLDPVVGGRDGSGWPFAEDLKASALYRMLQSLEGVERVEEILLFEFDLGADRRVGIARDSLTLDERSLFLPARTQVVVR